MNRYERQAIEILLLVAGGLVFLLAVGFIVFVCAVLIIDGGVGRVVGIVGLVGLALGSLSVARNWIRRNETNRQGRG